MKPFQIRLLLALSAIAFAAGCSSTTPAAPTPTSTVASAPSASPVSPATTPTTTATAAAPVDPFEQYWAALTKADPSYTPAKKAEQHEKFDTMVKTYCPQGRDALVQMKKVSTDINAKTKGAEGAKVAAVAVGALWEFGCGKGHDVDLYTPLPVKTATAAPAKPSWPCEPGYPNCTKADSERYKAQLEYKQQLERDRQQQRDVNGETYAEYCKRTGQPLATCQAG